MKKLLRVALAIPSLLLWLGSVGWVVLPGTASAQALSAVWATSCGGTAADRPHGVCLDEAGNAYVTGFFQSAPCYFGATNLVNANGYADSFLAKYKPDGTLLWVKQFPSTGASQLTQIAYRNGRVWLGGVFGQTGTFGFTSLVSKGAYDACLVQTDTNGNVLWAAAGGNTKYDFGYELAVDAQGNCYAVGQYWGAATFGTNVLSAWNGASNLFVAKYDLAGNLLWVKTAGGSLDCEADGVAVDDGGNSFVSGVFEGTVSFGTTNLTSQGGLDMFLASYDPSGNLKWVVQGGGTGDQSWAKVALDAQTNLFVAGNFTDGGTWGTTNFNYPGGTNLFIAKYNSQGKLLWVNAMPGSGQNRIFGAPAVNFAGEFYASGRFIGTLDFGGTTLTRTGETGFVLKVGPQGKLHWVAPFFTSPGRSEAYNLAVAKDGALVVSGWFGSGTCQVDPTTTLTGQGDWDGFLVKFKSDRPKLKMAYTNQALLVSWPTNAIGYTLQSRTNLHSPQWADDPNPVANNGDQFTVTNPASGTRFFGLRP